MFDEFLKWATNITVGGVGAWGALAGIITLLIRQKPINDKIRNEREGNLLRERANDMRGMRRRISELEAEQRADRHVINNLEQCFDSLLMMIELNPERAKEAAQKAREMRDKMKEREATEKAAILQAQATNAEDGIRP